MIDRPLYFHLIFNILKTKTDRAFDQDRRGNQNNSKREDGKEAFGTAQTVKTFAGRVIKVNKFFRSFIVF